MSVIQTKGGGPDNLVLLKFIWDIGLWDWKGDDLFYGYFHYILYIVVFQNKKRFTVIKAS